MKTKEKTIHPTEQHVLIMIMEVCKHCSGSINLTGMTFNYVWAKCTQCGREFIAGYTAITQTVETGTVSSG